MDNNSNNTLFRSRTDKFLGGVLGGLSKHLGIDSALLRIIVFVISLLLFQLPLMAFLYVLAWLFMPENKGLEVVELSDEKADSVNQDERKIVPWTKILLISGAGLCLLLLLCFLLFAGGTFVFVKELFDIQYNTMPDFWSNVFLLLFGTIVVLFLPVAVLILMLNKSFYKYDSTLKWFLLIVWVAAIFMVVSSIGSFVEYFNGMDVDISTI